MNNNINNYKCVDCADVVAPRFPFLYLRYDSYEFDKEDLYIYEKGIYRGEFPITNGEQGSYFYTNSEKFNPTEYVELRGLEV